jgi:hypothetical protein
VRKFEADHQVKEEFMRRNKSWVYTITIIAMLTSASTYAQYARILSRANCANPTIPLLSPSTGLTFNESVSWDPKFWAGRNINVTSKHIWSRWVGGTYTGYWLDRNEATYSGGNVNVKTWRAWAGKVSPYRDVTVAGDKKGYRHVQGTHREKIGGTMSVSARSTSAIDCNLTRW